MKNPNYAVSIGIEPNTLAYVLIYPHEKNHVSVRWVKNICTTGKTAKSHFSGFSEKQNML